MHHSHSSWNHTEVENHYYGTVLEYWLSPQNHRHWHSHDILNRETVEMDKIEETSLVLKTVERANVSELETGKKDMSSVQHLKIMPLSYSVLKTEKMDMESVQH
ncbi:hypothetical protein ACFX19_038056 [Malus domestica]